jgi:LysR family transcriptional regulator, transcriptional activator for dmlA
MSLGDFAFPSEVSASVCAARQLPVTPPLLTDDAFDVRIGFNEPPDTRVVARRLAANRRLLCAAPFYIALRGMPLTAHDLTRHNCIGIRQGDEAYGVWRLTSERDASRKTGAVRINVRLTSIDARDGRVSDRAARDVLARGDVTR